MPLSFDDVYTQYRKSGLTDKISLADYAKLGNFATGTSDYDQANNGWFGQGVKKGSYWLNQGIDATPLPNMAGAVTGGLYSVFGGTPEAGEAMGRGLPRSFVNMLPMAGAALLAPETGGLSLAAMGGLAGTGALSAAETYEQTGSKGQALVSGALPFAGAAGGAVAGRVLMPYSQKLLSASPLKANALQYLGTQAASVASMEATGRMFGTNQTPFWSADNALNIIFGNAPFVAHGALKGIRNGGFVRPEIDSALAKAAAAQLPSTLDETAANVQIDDMYKEAMKNGGLHGPPTPAEQSASVIGQSYDQGHSLAEASRLKAKLALEESENPSRTSPFPPEAPINQPNSTILGQNVEQAHATSLASDPVVQGVGKAVTSLKEELARAQHAQQEIDAQASFGTPLAASSRLDLKTTTPETAAKLKALGYSDAEISAMHPNDAYVLAEEGVSAQPSSAPPVSEGQAVSPSAAPTGPPESVGRPPVSEEAVPVEQAAAPVSGEGSATVSEAPSSIVPDPVDVAGDQAKAIIQAVPVSKPEDVHTHEQAAGMLQQANAISKVAEGPAVTDAKVTKRIDDLAKDGNSPTQAMQKASTSFLAEATDTAMRHVDQIVEKNKGGRPRNDPSKLTLAEQAATEFYTQALGSKDPEIQQLLKVVKPGFEHPENQFNNPSGSMKEKAHINVLKTFKAFMEDSEIQAKPIEEKVKILAKSIKTAINRRAYKGSVGGKEITTSDIYDPGTEAELAKQQLHPEEETPYVKKEVDAALPKSDGSTDGDRGVEAQAGNIRDLILTGRELDIQNAVADPNNPLHQALAALEVDPETAFNKMRKLAGQTGFAKVRKYLAGLVTPGEAQAESPAPKSKSSSRVEPSKLTSDKRLANEFEVFDKGTPKDIQNSLNDPDSLAHQMVLEKDKNPSTIYDETVKKANGDLKQVRNYFKFLLSQWEPSETKGNEGGQVAVASVPQLRLAPEEVFRRTLIKQGVTGEQASALVDKFITPVLKVLGLKDVHFAELLDDMRNGKDVGLSTVSGPLRAMWFGASDVAAKWTAEQQAHGLGVILAHEAGHSLEHLANMGLLDDLSMAKWKALQDHFGTHTMQENAQLIQTMAETLLPSWMQNSEVLSQLSRPINGSEAMATAHAILTMAKVDPASAEMGGTLIPKAARSWFSVFSDWVRRIVGSTKSVGIVHPKSGIVDRMNHVVKNFQDLKNAFREAEENVQKFNGLFQVDQDTLAPASLLQTPEPGQKEPLWKRIARLGDWTAGETGPKTKIGAVAQTASRWLEDLPQLIQRRPQLAPLGSVVLRMPENLKWVMDRAIAPFVTEPDGKGGMTTLSKARKKQLNMVVEDYKTNRLSSDIELWEQDQRDKGKPTQFDLTNPKNSDKALSDRLNSIGKESKDAITQYLTSKRASNKIIQGEILDTYGKESTLKLATAITSWMPELRDSAKEIAGNMFEGVKMQKAAQAMTDPVQQQQMLQQSEQIMNAASAAIPDLAVHLKVLDFAYSSADTLYEMKQKFDAAPNFGSRVITGKWMVRGYDATGKQVGMVGIKDGSEESGARTVLKSRGAVKFSNEEVKRRWNIDMNDDMKKAIAHAENSWMNKFQDALGPNIDPELLATFQEQHPLDAEFDRLKQGERVRSPGEKDRSSMGDLDMVQAHRAYTGIIARSLANRLARADWAYESTDPNLKKYPDQVQQVKDGMEAYMTPDSEIGRKITRFISTYYMAANLPTDLAVGVHGLFTILPESVSRTGSVVQSTKLMSGALKDLFKHYMNGSLKMSGDNESFDGWFNKEEANVFRSAKEKGILERHQFSDAMDGEGMDALALHQAANRGIISTAAGKAGSMWNAFSNMSMRLFHNFATFNARLSTLLGYRMAKAQGMDYQSAVDSAMEFARTSTFASGRAGRAPGAFTGKDHTIGQVAYCMTSYQRGCLAMLGRYAEHAILPDSRAQEYGITKADQKAAAKAFTTAIGVRFAAGGAMALPGLGALSAVWEKIFHKSLGGSIYNAFGQGMDQDEKEGSMVAGIATHGFVNALLARAGVPVDLATKFAMAGLPGMSARDGFDPISIFGPSASFLKSAVTGLTGFANDKGLVNTGKSVLPPALRKILDLWANGDATDSTGRGEGLSALEKTLYAVGFDSQRLSKSREYQHYTDLQTQRTAMQEKQDVAKVVDLYNSGNSSEAMQTIQRMAADSGYTKDPSTLAHKVAEKIVDKALPPDVRRSGSPQVAAAMMPTLRAIGLPMYASHEVMRQSAIDQIQRSLGYGMHGPSMQYGNPYQRAARIDQATAVNPETPFQAVFAPYAAH